MADTQRQRRRGTTAQHATFTGAAGEGTVDTDRWGWVIHDGLLAGGYPVPSGHELQKQSMVYAAGSGADTITLTLWPAPLAWVAGMKFAWKQASSNTGAATINPNALGAKTLKKLAGGALADLEAGDLVAGVIYEGTYDGTNVQVGSGGLGGGGGGLTLINRQTAVSVAQLDFTSLGTLTDYAALLIAIELAAPSGSDQFQMQMRKAGAFVTANYRMVYEGLSSAGGAISNNSNSSGAIALSPAVGGTGLGGFVEIAAPGSTGVHFASARVALRSSTDVAVVHSAGECTTAGALDGLRFKFASGNIASGSVSVFGVRNS